MITSDDSDRENGFEAWRVLTIRFEPQMGIRRMKEVAELSALQNKRCKHATETSLILLDIDRRRKRIPEIGGQDPSNDTLVSVLWMSMDAGSRSHVSGKLNVAEVTYVDLRNALLIHKSDKCHQRRKQPQQIDDSYGREFNSFGGGRRSPWSWRYPFGLRRGTEHRRNCTATTTLVCE